MSHPIKYIARITLEATTPLAVGSGRKGLWVDKMVARDANGLPYLPGTSLTGVLRHAIDDEQKAVGTAFIDVDDLFGHGDKRENNQKIDGKGSRLALSSACLVGSDGRVVEELQSINFSEGFYSYFDRLPERDHVRINHKGVSDAEGHGKFDEQLVHRGSRFVFELELTGTPADETAWHSLLRYLASPAFRIGSGTRKGFGKLRVVGERSQYRRFDLTNKNDLLAYLSLSGSLNDAFPGARPLAAIEQTDHYPGWVRYALDLKPTDFFLFDAGVGDDDADNIPKKELSVEWDTTGKPTINKDKAQYLIPATSVKGAIAHRTAYHYNRLNKHFIQHNLPNTDQVPFDLEGAVLNTLREKYPDLFTVNGSDFQAQLQNLNLPSSHPRWKELITHIEALTLDTLPGFDTYTLDLKETLNNEKPAHVGENNPAVVALFGKANDSKKRLSGASATEEPTGIRGNVILDDVYLPADSVSEKLFNHVRIDRFTQGAFDGALYQEKTLYSDKTISLTIWVNRDALTDVTIKAAFENTLNDLREGCLPLGGRTLKGHGIFTGTLTTTDHDSH